MSYAQFLRGYAADASQVNTGLVDYVPSNYGMIYDNVININIGRIDYVIGLDSYYSGAIIIQSGGFKDVNWELIELLWNNIEETWN